MTTLYRKHRPQKFSDIVNQNHIKLTLQHEIESGKLAHAYLFCGPRGIGKTTLARIFAKSLNCLNRKDNESEPCNTCESCLDITAGRKMDIVEVDAASHTGVDNVRENIIASSRIAPSNSKYKVYIIDEAHMLSTGAFNALLKVMEEPPENVVFILCTTEAHKVPTTIISRCQRFDFRKILVKDAVKRLAEIAALENIEIDRETLEEIARHSEGHMRDAESLLGQIISISGTRVTKEEAALVIPRSDINEVVNLIECIAKKDANNGIRLANKLIDEGVDLKTYINNCVEIVRKLLILSVNPLLADTVCSDFGENIEIRIKTLANALGPNTLIEIMNELNQARLEIKDAYIVQLPLELAVFKLCTKQTASSYSASAGQTDANIPAPNPDKVSIPDASSNSNGIKADIEQISSRWDDIVNHIKKHHQSASVILQVCEPRSIENSKLCLAFKYKFHKDRAESPQMRSAIQNAVSDIMGQNLELIAIIDESIEVKAADDNAHHAAENGLGCAYFGNTGDMPPPPDDSSQSEMINDLLRTFGGRVIG